MIVFVQDDKLAGKILNEGFYRSKLGIICCHYGCKELPVDTVHSLFLLPTLRLLDFCHIICFNISEAFKRDNEAMFSIFIDSLLPVYEVFKMNVWKLFNLYGYVFIFCLEHLGLNLPFCFIPRLLNDSCKHSLGDDRPKHIKVTLFAVVLQGFSIFVNWELIFNLLLIPFV